AGCRAGESSSESCTGCAVQCGDGVVGPGEACDAPFLLAPFSPGFATPSCPCGESCNESCTGCAVQCGDGVVGAPEVCDPPFSPAGCPAGESCNATCTGCAVPCGGGVVAAAVRCAPAQSPRTGASSGRSLRHSGNSDCRSAGP